MKAFRLDEQTIDQMEQIRDRERFPTQSDFVRAAIKRLIREERHRQIRRQIQRSTPGEDATAIQPSDAGPAVEDWFARLERADRGEL